MINFRCKDFLAIVSVLLWMPASPCVRAQDEAATQPKEVAMIRAWIFPEQAPGQGALVFKVADPAQPRVLATSDGGRPSMAANYLSLPGGGNVSLELSTGDQPMLSQMLALRGERFYTLVAWQSEGKWKVKAFVDQKAGPTDFDRPVRVLNFADKRETEITIGTSTKAKIPSGGMEEFRVPPKVDTITAKVLSEDGAGAPTTTVVEADMSSMPGAYVVIAPDYRGRMRPRVLPGGEVPEVTEAIPPEEAQGQLQ